MKIRLIWILSWYSLSLFTVCLGQSNNDLDSLLNQAEKELSYLPINSIKLTQQAIKLATLQNNREKTIEAKHLLGRAYYFAFQPEKSLEYLNETKKEVENSSLFYYSVQNDIANTLLYVGNYDIAKSKLLKNLNLISDTSSLVYAKTLSILLKVYSYTGKLDSAKHYGHKALKIYQKLNKKTQIIYMLNNLGNIYKDDNNYEIALQLYNQAEVLNKDDQDIQALTSLFINKGSLLLTNGDYDNAIEYLNKGQKLALTYDRKHFLVECFHIKSKLFEAIEKPDSALTYLKKYVQLKDVITNNQVVSKTIGIKYEFDLKEKEYEASSLRQKQKYTLLLSLSGIICLILLILYVIKKNKINKSIILKEKENLELLSQQKQRELTTNLQFTHDRNRFIQYINERIEDILKMTDQSAEKELKKLQSKLKLTEYNDQEWKRIKVHFEQIHPSFFDHLSKNYPKLSNNDLRICAYIKMRLTTKEIANLMYLQPRSIQSTKYRIKKKMNLSEKEDLIEIINNV